MYYTYITTNSKKTVFYTGMTNDLKRRMSEHKKGKGIDDHFTGKYYCTKLVYYETFEKPIEAIKREKEIKKMIRNEKIELIKNKNPRMAFYRV